MSKTAWDVLGRGIRWKDFKLLRQHPPPSYVCGVGTENFGDLSLRRKIAVAWTVWKASRGPARIPWDCTQVVLVSHDAVDEGGNPDYEKLLKWSAHPINQAIVYMPGQDSPLLL